jgi:hypothetical protein
MKECSHTREESWWEHDDKGLPLVRVCDKCIKDKLRGFHPAVLTDEQKNLLGVETELEYSDVVEDQIEPD